MEKQERKNTVIESCLDFYTWQEIMEAVAYDEFEDGELERVTWQ